MRSLLKLWFHSRAVRTCVLWLVVPSLATAQSDASSADLEADVLRLVEELDANQLTRRQAAEESLLKLGPPALQFFPPVTRRTPAEVKERLGRVRTELEKLLGELAAQPTRIELQGEMAIADAFAAIEQQSGNRVVGYERRAGRAQVDFQDVPYWQALDQLLDQAALDIDPFGGESGALVVKARGDGDVGRFGAADYRGVFRIEAERIETRRDLRNTMINGMRLTMSVTWEPRIRPIALQQQLDQIEVVDDRGEVVQVDVARQRINASTDSGASAVEMVIPMALPSRRATRIDSLKGVLTALVPGSQEVFEFSDLDSARDVEQRKAGVAVTFERSRKNRDLYEIRVRVRFDEAAGALQSHRGWIYQNEAYVVDPRGNRAENVGLQTTRREETEIGVAYLFPLPQGVDGCKFVYKTPATILRLPVEYELQEIPLP